MWRLRKLRVPSAGTGGEGSRCVVGPGLWAWSDSRGAAAVSVGLRAFASASPGSPARPAARKGPAGSRVRSLARPSASPPYRTRKTRRPWMILAPVGNLGLSAFKEGPQAVVRRPLSTAYPPLRSFLLLLFSSSSFPLSPLRPLPPCLRMLISFLESCLALEYRAPLAALRRGLQSWPQTSSPERYWGTTSILLFG